MARKTAKALPPNMITVYAEILQETEKAILVRCDEDADGEWLPKSQIKYSGERGDTGVEIEIPELMADEKGFFDGMGRPKVEISPAPAEPKQPEMVTFFGVRNFDEDTENDICFEIHYEVDDGLFSVAKFFIPKTHIVGEGQDGDYPGEDERRYIEISVAHAIEARLMEDPEYADESERGASIVPNDRHWLNQETITVTCELTQKEKAEYAEEMAAASGEKDRFESELDGIKKHFKRLIETEDSKISRAAKIVREGNEEREIFCDKLADYNTCEIVWTDAHGDNEEIKRRKMTAEEKQLPLETKSKPDNNDTSLDESEGLDFDAVVDSTTDEEGIEDGFPPVAELVEESLEAVQ